MPRMHHPIPIPQPIEKATPRRSVVCSSGEDADCSALARPTSSEAALIATASETWQNTKQVLINWVVVSNISYVHPYLGKISNLTNIFQMG